MLGNRFAENSRCILGLQCLNAGHFIYECKSTRPYLSRPSRTQQLAKVNTLDKLKIEGKPSVDLPDEFKTKCVFTPFTNSLYVLIAIATIRTGTANKLLEAKEKERAKDKPGESSTNAKLGKRQRRYAPYFQTVTHRNSLISFSAHPRRPVLAQTLTLTRIPLLPTLLTRPDLHVHAQDPGLVRLLATGDAEGAFRRQIAVIVVAEVRTDEDVTQVRSPPKMTGTDDRHP